jgi:tRNA (cytidine/uridine-2'-O-)-methyltransferase
MESGKLRAASGANLYDPLLHVVLYKPEIPPNTGNIGRTCVAVGAKLWMIKPLGFDIDEKARRRAGLDYWEHIEWDLLDAWENLPTVLDTQVRAGRCWFFSKRATRLYTEIVYQPGDMLVFGSESSGLPDAIFEHYPEQMVTIPMRTPVRSINLSAAAAVAMYEAVRQFHTRGIESPP